MDKKHITAEKIESFLQGSNPKEFVVAIEAGYNKASVDLVINDQVNPKRIEQHPFKPFLWLKEEVIETIYGGKRLKIINTAEKFGIKITKLRTWDDNNESPDRLTNGYKYLATCTHSYNNLTQFFKDGGMDVFSEKNRGFFIIFSPVEQFMIQTGIRLFKGLEDYDDLHRFQFDLETEGLFSQRDAIFQIGVRDNKGMEHVLEANNDKKNPLTTRESEREMIKKFFRVIDIIQPDIITGYNSESFDWPFLFARAERLNMPITDFAITLNRISKIKRKSSTVKFGGDTEKYDQTMMYGYNIIDISHAVRRAMAINSEIKAWGLKYITQYSNIAKPNRVYVPGDKINTIWSDKINKYAFNDVNGDWYVISDTKPLKPEYKIVKGDYVVQRYLCDDLWETEQIDNLFNQASFLIGKIVPTSFQRSSTMGTAGQWKLIMAAWSYENKLAIPEVQKKRDFTGGLARLLELGYAKNVYKLDFAALYPKIQLTHGIFPLLDITGMMEGMLTYIVDTRDKFKFLAGKEKKKYQALQLKLDTNLELSDEEKIAIKEQIVEHKALHNLYDKKQLPLKILANSWFGSYGAPYIFNWGDTDLAEETTCRGRQYLRLMVRFFTEKYGFRALVGDTDGFNFAAPDNLNEIKYIAKGTHWKTEEDGGKKLVGIYAVLAEFNETYMEGRMGLDLDDICSSTINFARKNYANDIDGKIKLVGNSVKSKKMSVYIEEFLNKAIRMLLDGDGHSFISFYYEYVDKIYNYQIPLVKIASKAKVKQSIPDYKKKATMKNKAGNPMPKQAHMELAIKNNLEINLGDVLYYINTGTAKSHGDLKTTTDKITKISTVNLNCNLIDPKVVEKDFELIKELEMLKKAMLVSDTENQESYATLQSRIDAIDEILFTDEYNVARYLDSFNKKVKPLLVCFNTEVRNSILLDIVKVKDKITKKVTEKLKDRKIFTKSECELVSGIPNKVGDQDTYEDLMTMEDKEIKFWLKVNMVPNNMLECDWDILKADYLIRMEIVKQEGIQREKEVLDDIFKRLEINELTDIEEKRILPIDILIISDISVEDEMLVSRKWGEPLCSVFDIFKYKETAIERDAYYKLIGSEKFEDPYQQYLEYVFERKILTGDTITDITNHEIKNNDGFSIVLKEESDKIVITKPNLIKPIKLSESESDEDDDDGAILVQDDEGDIVRTGDKIVLDDGFDDTMDLPEDYVVDEGITEGITEVIEDEWNF